MSDFFRGLLLAVMFLGALNVCSCVVGCGLEEGRKWSSGEKQRGLISEFTNTRPPSD